MADLETHKTNVLQEDEYLIVIGASAGGFEAIKTIIGGLPPDFRPPILIVWHMSPDIKGILPSVLNKINRIYAAHALSGEAILPNRIYVAPPDHHLLIEDGEIRLTKGPKENHFRPAVDPLFRSAAYYYGNRVIGIVLSGGLDDGTAGLWRIKHNGGLAIVQDPENAEVKSMPESALREVAVDHCVSVEEIADLLKNIVDSARPEKTEAPKDENTKIEIGIAAGERKYDRGSLKIGELSPLTCPECHGVLSKITEGNLTRYRCHTGHAFSLDTLLYLITQKTEENLYSAIGAMEESMLLMYHIGDHLAEINQAVSASAYFNKAKQVEARVEILRNKILDTEQLNHEKILREQDNFKSEN